MSIKQKNETVMYCEVFQIIYIKVEIVINEVKIEGKRSKRKDKDKQECRRMGEKHRIYRLLPNK